MKKICFSAIVSLCMIVVACFAFSASAAEIVKSGTCGANGSNLTWALDDDGVLTISGSGDMEVFYNPSSVPWYSYRESITNVVIGDSVTSIGAYAFYYCRSITSVTIGDNVKNIGDLAFYSCYIEKVYITSLEAWMNISFSDWSSNPLLYCEDLYLNGEELTELIVPNNINAINKYSFYGYDSLTNITIGDNVTTIGMGAFYGCDSLVNVTISDSVTSIGSEAFYNCDNLTSVTIPDSVTYIGSFAFAYCNRLASVTVGDSVATIGQDAFSYCDNIEKVFTTNLDAWCVIEFCNQYSNPLCNGAAFYLNDTLIKELVIPESVSDIGDYVFYACASFESISIGKNVTSIGKDAFYNCVNIEKVLITDLLSWGQITFSNSCSNPKCYGASLYFENQKIISNGLCGNNLAWMITDGMVLKILGTGNMNDYTSYSDYTWDYYRKDITAVVIDDGVTNIGNYAFYNCDNLTEVSIGTGVTSIGDYSFFNCAKLKDMSIYGITRIGSYAFYNCNSMKSVTVGRDVTTIGGGAFRDCNNIEKVNIFDIDTWRRIEFAGDCANPLCYGSDLYLNGEKVTELYISSASRTAIYDYAFYNCDSIVRVYIQYDVSYIGMSSFAKCSNLQEVIINTDNLFIDSEAFANCSKLLNVTVSGSTRSIDKTSFANSVYVTLNGKAKSNIETFAHTNNLPFTATDNNANELLYSGKCGDNLVWYLYRNGTLDIQFINDLTCGYIDDYSQETHPEWKKYCTMVRTVNIPSGITRIGNHAFECFSGLLYVNYKADKIAWSMVDIGENNSPLEKAVYNWGNDPYFNINVPDFYKTPAKVNGKIIPIISNINVGISWQELKETLVCSEYTDVVVYNHCGETIGLDDILSTGYILHHVHKDNSVIEEVFISVTGDVTGDGKSDYSDVQNVLSHLAGADNDLYKIAVDTNLDDNISMEELNKFIATFR